MTVAGIGPERDPLRDLARRLRLDAEFPGWVEGRAREELLRAADLVAVPSLWPEPFGLVGIEAGCFGVPAAAFAVGGISEWLEAGVNGELAPGDPPTAGGLAEALVRALRDPEHHARLRLGSWRAAGRFGLRAHVEGLERILAGAAGTPGGK